MTAPLLEVQGLHVTWPATHRSAQAVHAVRGVDLAVPSGGTMALVGTSGSGKTSLAQAVLGLVGFEGVIRFAGRDLHDWLGRDSQAFRRRVQLLMQNPRAALNPRMTIGSAIEEVLHFNRSELNAAGRARETRELLEQVELPRGFGGRLPHQMSGGRAAARLAGQGPGGSPRTPDSGRAGVVSGCGDPGPRSESPEKSATTSWTCVSIHCPRPRNGRGGL